MQVALVTGASRGVGRGVATSLHEAGFKVFATGRNIGAAHLDDAIVRIACDHLRDEQTASVFAQIASETGRLDVLVNSAWGGYEGMVENGVFTWQLPFWEQPVHRWTSMMEAGVRAALMTSSQAVKMMLAARKGLIVNISYWAAQMYIGNVLYGMAKAATDKMTADMAYELRPHGIAVLSLYPGLVRTEAVMEAAQGGWLDVSNSESPEFVGRVIAALALDRTVLERTGRVFVAATVASEYRIKDTDGNQPIPLTLENA
jgi:NAD(P)-dependent dehydrogenase (short-subunit alcohol dehydrogenase family)